MRVYLECAAIFAGAYIIGAFCAWDINPGHWTDAIGTPWRFCLIMLACIGVGLRYGFASLDRE